MTIQRYAWEDALIDAQTQGLIPNGALLVGLKIGRAIHWQPKNGKPAGLYWKNDDALKAVGCGRATYFKHRQELFDSGFFVEVKGNLIPQMPDQSTVETHESTVETIQSTLETQKSTGDNPLSVDILTVDAFSGDSSTASLRSASQEDVESIKEQDQESSPHSLNPTGAAGTDEMQESTVETLDEEWGSGVTHPVWAAAEEYTLNHEKKWQAAVRSA